jgi:cyclopropane fatty-acyl-phospholipid synthase-like methyltransferase
LLLPNFAEQNHAMIDFWNYRYGGAEYAYGKEPNVFFKEQLDLLPSGKILLPAEGEGRNAVYAAEKGWQASAYDWSENACKKAMQLAEEKNVDIDYQICSLTGLNFEPESFDVIALIYVHFPNAIRSMNFERLTSYLKPGGSIILEGFSPNHLHYQAKQPSVGGPKSDDFLYSIEDMKLHFDGYRFKTLKQQVVTLEEGDCHVGQTEVARMHAVKP